jgi:hypothetical protein
MGRGTVEAYLHALLARIQISISFTHQPKISLAFTDGMGILIRLTTVVGILEVREITRPFRESFPQSLDVQLET